MKLLKLVDEWWQNCLEENPRFSISMLLLAVVLIGGWLDRPL